MKRLILLFSLLPFISYSQYTAIPDQYFEQELIYLGYDNVIDGQVLTSNISGVNSLYISYNNISDLTGIEDFTALTYLNLMANDLTSLDVSQNTALTELFCSYNQLTSLDVSQNTTLVKFNCEDNQLTSLDVSQNTSLTYLDCGSNQLTSLDLSQNTALNYLSCDRNQLTTLDVSQNTTLVQLLCEDNQLTSLDLSQNTALTYLHCYNNQLTCLNLKNGNNLNFAFLHISDNPNLTCIEVDDAVYSNTNWLNNNSFDIDLNQYFSNNCNYPSGSGCNLTTITEQTNSISLYPNPTNNLITLDIEGYNGSVNVEVYDLTGKLLQTTTNTTISMGEYAKGIYVFKVAYGDRVEKLKVVKE